MDETNDAVRVNVVAGAGSGGTAATDDAVFTPGSGTGTPIMGFADETSPDSVDEGDVGVVRMTLTRALHVNLRDATGAELSVGGGTQYSEDAVHASGDKVTMAGVVRKNTAASLAGTDGDITIPIVDTNGLLWVNASGAAVPVTDNGGNLSIDDGGNVISVDDGAGSLTIDNAALSVTGGGVEATALRVTIATDSTGVLSVDDNGGSLTIDNAALSVTGGGVEATALRVTIATDSTGVLSVDDNGGNLSIDDGGNSITVDNTVISVVGSGTEATAQRVTIATDSTGVLSVDDNGGSLTVDGTVSITANSSVNVAQLAGTTTDTNSGNKSAGTLRVVIATDQVQLTNALKVDGSAVTQPVSVTGATTGSAPSTATIGTGSATVIASNANRKGLALTNTSTSGQRISLHFANGTAVLDSGITLWPGDSFVMSPYTFTTSAITGIGSAASGTIGLQEFT